MEAYKNSSPLMVLGIMMIMAAFLDHVTAFPVTISGKSNNGNIGQKVTVASKAELNLIMNHTVPPVLTSSINPYEYLKQQGHNVTGLAILPYLMSTQNGPNGFRSRRSNTVLSTESCPVTWMVNMEANRDPVRIQKAVCNGQGTTCLSEGKPACEEFSITYQIKRFLGIDSDGNQIWQKQEQAVPVACQCSVA